MNKLLTIMLSLCLIFAAAFAIHAGQAEAKASVSIAPNTIIQGDPLEISIKGSKKTDTVTATFGQSGQVSISNASSIVPLASFDKKLIGFVPIDINKKPGFYEIHITVKDSRGRINQDISKSVQVIAREKVTAPLGIPQKLGGNTQAAAKTLVDTLAQENQSLLNLGTADHALWKKAFAFPVDNPIVTDVYGYSRDTVGYSITHKGTDFRAIVGTKVYAVNDGVVKLARLGRNYGNTIVIDHGNGIQSFYMHLSEMDVKVGDRVTRGQLIGLSGQTGYADAPHLHFTLRINDISIDPEVFMGFFK